MSNSKEFKIVYDNQSHMWTDDNRFNKMLVMSQLNYLTDKFKAKGFLFVQKFTNYSQFLSQRNLSQLVGIWEKLECLLSMIFCMKKIV